MGGGGGGQSKTSRHTRGGRPGGGGGGGARPGPLGNCCPPTPGVVPGESFPRRRRRRLPAVRVGCACGVLAVASVLSGCAIAVALRFATVLSDGFGWLSVDGSCGCRWLRLLLCWFFSVP